MSDEIELKEDLKELRSHSALECYLREKLWKSIVNRLWLCLQDFVKLH